MRVLVICEESQAVMLAFLERGHDAYSCDLQECSGGRPDRHYVGDCFEVFHKYGPWDLVIAHPPCTHLSNAGAVHLFKGGVLNQERYKKGLQGKDFFMKCLNLPVEKICVENPRPSKIFELPRHTQEIQPYHFGHTFKKATRLWIRGLKPLMPTNIVWKRVPYVSAGKGNSVALGCVNSAKDRSKTFPGIARAMAEQWG